MRRLATVTIMTAAASIACFATPAEAQEAGDGPPPHVRELMQLWSTAQTWEIIAPQELELSSMTPFRAVYERSYRSSSGGAVRNDWYIWQVEQIGWFGDDAFMVSHIDSGNPRWEDATARTHSKVIDAGSHAIRFGVFPKSGTLADYAVVRSHDTGYQTTIVDADGESTRTTLDTSPALDELNYPLALALLEKEEGMAFRIPVYDARSNAVQHVPVRVAGTDTIRDDAGHEHEVWVVHTPSSRQGKMRKIFVSDQPPYYFGTDTWDVMANTTTPWHRFQSVTVLPDALDDATRAAEGDDQALLRGSMGVEAPAMRLQRTKKMFRVLLTSLGAWMGLIVGVSNAWAQTPPDVDPRQQLPDPDTTPPATDQPIKVFILMGQSNMVGFGRVEPETTKGTLAYLTEEEGKYTHLQDDDGNWTVRNDVWCVKTTVGQKQDWLQPGFGARGDFIGPEFQFGHVMGHIHDEPVLIIKASQGNRSLGWDILPPGSEEFVHDGRAYAAYGDTPSSWIEGEAKEPVNWYAGKQYDDFVRDIHEVLNDLTKFFPSYDDQGYEIAGFAWWQGHKDQNAAHASRYELNMVNLITCLRKEFETPDAPFVLATIAFDGQDLSGHGLTVAEAQLAVSGDSGQYSEFVDNVKTVDVRDFWRDQAVSPNGQGYHYNHNAETYMEVGNALGWAMADLLIKQHD